MMTYLTHDIWRVQAKKMPRRRSFFIQLVRIVVLAARGFNREKCNLRASALTYYTLLSIVPILAMGFGVAKGFGFEKVLEEQIRQNLAQHGAVVERIITFANSLLENTRGGLLAGIGIIILMWSVIKVLGNIEQSFNDIWGIKAQRTLARRFSDYLSIMFICPILLILSSSLTVFVATQFEMLAAKLSLPHQVQEMVNLGVRLSPYAMIWVLFSFLYIFLPNTKVRFSSGIAAGIIAGSLYQLLQFVYITFQVGVARYNAIYGSFAALPLFLVWLQVSWRIVLFGAELSFAHQNVETYEFEPDCLSASRSHKNLLSLAIAHLCVKRFARAEKPLSAGEIAHRLDIPIRLVRELLYELTQSQVLSAVKTVVPFDDGYQPGRDINNLSIAGVIEALDARGTATIPVAMTPEFTALSEKIISLKTCIEKIPANSLLKNL
jgi:membrane protein